MYFYNDKKSCGSHFQLQCGCLPVTKMIMQHGSSYANPERLRANRAQLGWNAHCQPVVTEGSVKGDRPEGQLVEKRWQEHEGRKKGVETRQLLQEVQEESIISCLDDQLLNLFFLMYLFFYFWLLWDLAAGLRLSLVAANGAPLQLGCRHLFRWLLFIAETRIQAAGFSSCGSQALQCNEWPKSMLIHVFPTSPNKSDPPGKMHRGSDITLRILQMKGIRNMCKQLPPVQGSIRQEAGLTLGDEWSVRDHCFYSTSFPSYFYI